MWPWRIETAWIEPGTIPPFAVWHRQAAAEGVRTQWYNDARAPDPSAQDRPNSVRWELGAQPVRTGTHLLVVEDDAHVRALLAEELREGGYEVEEAGDGRDALAAIMLVRPLLLITDCNMPNMTGNELVETLMRDDGLCSIPVIVISALIQPAIPANVLVFLAKPFTLLALHAAVRDCLARVTVRAG